MVELKWKNFDSFIISSKERKKNIFTSRIEFKQKYEETEKFTKLFNCQKTNEWNRERWRRRRRRKKKTNLIVTRAVYIPFSFIAIVVVFIFIVSFAICTFSFLSILHKQRKHTSAHTHTHKRLATCKHVTMIQTAYLLFSQTSNQNEMLLTHFHHMFGLIKTDDCALYLFLDVRSLCFY